MATTYPRLSKGEINQRFPGRELVNKENNVLGFGVKNAYIPPLADSKSLAAWYWKRDLIMMNTFNWEVMTAAFWQWDWTGDFWRGQWYHSAAAVGNQLYPNGIHLFYDMFSAVGLAAFWFDWLMNIVWSILSPVTLFVPLDTLLRLLEQGTDESDWARVYYEVGPIWFVKVAAKQLLCGRSLTCEIELGWSYISI